MKVTLPDGRICDVMCKHTKCGPPRTNLPSGVYHKTEIAIKLPDGTTLEGSATCSPHDVFSKTEGRRGALNRAFRKDKTKTHLSDADRYSLVKTMCSAIFKLTPKAKVARAAVATLKIIRDMRDAVASGSATLPIDPKTGAVRAFDDWAADEADKVLAKL